MYSVVLLTALTVGGESADFGDRFFLEMLEAKHHVGHLDAGVIDVILNFHAASGMAEQACESVAEYGVPDVTYMCGLVRVNARMLDNRFRRARCGGDRFLSGLRDGCAEEGGTVEESVEVAASSHFDARDAVDWRERIGNFLSEEPWGFFQALRELETHRRGGFPHGEFGRPLGEDGYVGFIALVDMMTQRFAEAFFDRFVQMSPSHRENQTERIG